MMMIPSAAISRAPRQRGRSGTNNTGSGQVVYLWSDIATWGGALPVAGAAVTIPVGTIVKFDLASSPALGLVTLNGELRFDPTQTQTFTATGISVASTGALQAGTAAAPWPWSSTLNIVINGPFASANKVSRANGGFQNNGAGENLVRGIVNMGGRIEMVVAPFVSGTKLNGHWAAAATSATFVDATSWTAGQRILVAPTTYYKDTSPEVLTLAANVTSVTTTTTTGPVVRRWGLMQYVNKTAAGVGIMSLTDTGYRPVDPLTPFSIDQRATVALLDRPITISAPNDTDWTTNNFGVHVMVMGLASVTRIDGIRILRGGQQDMQGRYPFHWHNLSYNTATGALNGDAVGYIRNSVVETSKNRGIVIHGTCGVTVDNNTIHGFRGQGIFMEDGVEQRCFVTNNIVSAGTKTSQGGVAGNVSTMVGGLKAFESADGPNITGGEGSAGYWITNPNNTFTGNEGYGMDGVGSWLSFATQAFGDNALALDPSSSAPVFANATQFTVSQTAAPVAGSHIGLNIGGTDYFGTASVVTNSNFPLFLATVTVTGMPSIDASVSALKVQIRPFQITQLNFTDNSLHSNSNVGHRLEFAVISELGQIRANSYTPRANGSSATYAGTPGGAAIPSSFRKFNIWKNATGGYQNRIELADYRQWTQADNMQEDFFGAHVLPAGGTISNTLFVGASLNNAETYTSTQPKSGVASYHGALVSVNGVFVQYAPVAGVYGLSNQGILGGGSITMWDFYTRSLELLHASGTGNEYLSAHPGVLIASPEFDAFGPIIDDSNYSAQGFFDFRVSVAGYGSQSGFTRLRGSADNAPGGSSYEVGWSAIPTDSTKMMMRHGYGIRAQPMKTSEGNHYVHCRKPNTAGSDQILGMSLTSYAGQGATFAQMDYRARILSSGEVRAGALGGADAAMGTPYTFTQFNDNSRVRLYRNVSTGVVTVDITIDGGATWTTKHTFGTTTLSDLFQYIGVEYSGNNANDIVRVPYATQHRARKWKLQTAFWDAGGEWNNVGDFLIPNQSFFTWGLTTSAIRVGSCPDHVATPTQYCHLITPTFACMPQQSPINSISRQAGFNLDRINPATDTSVGTWVVHDAGELTWLPFFNATMAAGQEYVLTFPDYPQDSWTAITGSKPWEVRLQIGAYDPTRVGQVLWLPWPAQLANPRVFIGAGGSLSADGASSGGSANPYGATTDPGDSQCGYTTKALVRSTNGFVCYRDTTRNLVGFKIPSNLDQYHYGGSAAFVNIWMVL